MTVKAKGLDQEHNIMFPPMARIQEIPAIINFRNKTIYHVQVSNPHKIIC